MSWTFRTRLLMAATFLSLLVSCAASASSQAAFLSLGATNTYNGQTRLTGSANIALLRIDNPFAGSAATALFGLHTASSGTGPALVGQSNSQTGGADSILGVMTSTTPGADSAAIRGQNNGTGANGIGLWGSQAGAGVGVYGTSASGRGVFGSAQTGTGVIGQHKSTTGTAPGVQGATSSTAANASGIYGLVSTALPGVGEAAVRGQNNGTGANGAGLWGSQAGSGDGVFGYAPSGVGVHGSSSSGEGVHGHSSSGDGVHGSSGTGDGVHGFSTSGFGVHGFSQSSNGVYGASGTGNAGYFNGNVVITGSLSVTDCTGCVRAPLKSEAVRPSGAARAYDGMVTTNKHGFATVAMPGSFPGAGRTFRYQLTIVGHSFAQAIVWTPMSSGRFTIRTNRPRTRVSWQVTN
jgi:hypothetical protein